MTIAVVGATGRTGREVLRESVRRGLDTLALARHPEGIEFGGSAIRVAAVDAFDRASLVSALRGCEALVSTLGIGSSRSPTTLYSAGIENILAAMSDNGIRKLAVVSAAPAGPRQEQPALERRILMPVLDRVFGETYDDMRRMEAKLVASDTEWVAVRPPRLVAKRPTGHYRIQIGRPPTRGRSITYGDLAVALLDSLERPDLYRSAPYVTN
jgi:putative NADH-flavin reductase